MQRKFSSHRLAAAWAARGALALLLIVLLISLTAAGRSQCPLCGSPVYFGVFRFCGCLG